MMRNNEKIPDVRPDAVHAAAGRQTSRQRHGTFAFGTTEDRPALRSPTIILTPDQTDRLTGYGTFGHVNINCKRNFGNRRLAEAACRPIADFSRQKAKIQRAK